MAKFAIAVHGGAGTILQQLMSPHLEQIYKLGLITAMDAGYTILASGGSAVDAVEAAVTSLEDFPLFNAGKGAVFNHIGKHEMDAAIMNGATLEAGAVCGISHAKNPVKVARAIMDKGENVLLACGGADEFAAAQGLQMEDDAYFFTQQRYDQWQEALKEDKVMLDHSVKKMGTVGAVALDGSGNLAAATSTGGLTNKKFGRVGDTPLIGAGTYANNDTCAISCTGVGELFIRSVVAHDISCLVAYKNLSLEEACNIVVHQKLVKIGGEGGLIAIDKYGNITMPFNSDGMYRACRSSNGNEEVMIYK